MNSATLRILPIHVVGEGRSEKTGRRSGDCNSVNVVSIVYFRVMNLADLVEDASVVRIKPAFVEKQAFLHCPLFSFLFPCTLSCTLSAIQHTSLEARHRCRNLDSACQQVGQCREGHGEEDAEEGGRGEEECLGLVPVDLRNRVHLKRTRSTIAAIDRSSSRGRSRYVHCCLQSVVRLRCVILSSDLPFRAAI